LDSKKEVDDKVNKALCYPCQPDDNGLLAFTEFVLLPAAALMTGKKEFRVERPDAEPVVYTDMAQMREDYKNDVLSPQLLKPAVRVALNRLLEPIRSKLKDEDEEWVKIFKDAYPKEWEERQQAKAAEAMKEASRAAAAKKLGPDGKKKEKKVKNKGTRHPGGRPHEDAGPKDGEELPVHAKE
jgi:tyrosyl-tRNA synthetase